SAVWASAVFVRPLGGLLRSRGTIATLSRPGFWPCVRSPRLCWKRSVPALRGPGASGRRGQRGTTARTRVDREPAVSVDQGASLGQRASERRLCRRVGGHEAKRSLGRLPPSAAPVLVAEGPLQLGLGEE